MDTTQLLLTVVVTVLTALLAIIGVQVVFILAEMRKTIEKINKIIDDTGQVTGGLSRSVTGMTGMFEGIKTGLNLVNLFGRKKGKVEAESD